MYFWKQFPAGVWQGGPTASTREGHALEQEPRARSSTSRPLALAGCGQPCCSLPRAAPHAGRVLAGGPWGGVSRPRGRSPAPGGQAHRQPWRRRGSARAGLIPKLQLTHQGRLSQEVQSPVPLHLRCGRRQHREDESLRAQGPSERGDLPDPAPSRAGSRALGYSPQTLCVHVCACPGQQLKRVSTRGPAFNCAGTILPDKQKQIQNNLWQAAYF